VSNATIKELIVAVVAEVTVGVDIVKVLKWTNVVETEKRLVSFHSVDCYSICRSAEGSFQSPFASSLY